MSLTDRLFFKNQTPRSHQDTHRSHDIGIDYETSRRSYKTKAKFLKIKFFIPFNVTENNLIKNSTNRSEFEFSK